MSRADRITKILEAIAASPTKSLSLHVIVANVFADYAPALAVDGALSALRFAEARGLIRHANERHVGTSHYVYVVAA